MVWFYGGGNEFGSATNPIYDGTNIARNQDVVVVTFNYRTNIFGFPLAPQLPITGQNLGYLDQRLVLDWIQRNIHAFGGDPKQTVMPQIHQLYPVPSVQYPNDHDGIDASARDYIFGCPISAVANDAARSTGQPIWRYVYNAYFPNQQPIPGLRAYHSSEIFEIFGTYSQHGATQQQIQLSNFMQTAWANFAKNPSGGPGWNTISSGTLGELGANEKIISNYDDADDDNPTTTVAVSNEQTLRSANI
ncbi:unnamed protein product [Rotaria sordida]|uniref:Carboxylesterase type B domain-containing protein n=2 Tax=Rotaria sordida TaxID=392033 RepID=A0A814AM56_9BILA|nr:unnamed protein product [Rotaria sordida]